MKGNGQYMAFRAIESDKLSILHLARYKYLVFKIQMQSFF